MNGIKRALNAAKKQFDLPAVGIKHDNLVDFQIEAIRENEICLSKSSKDD